MGCKDSGFGRNLLYHHGERFKNSSTKSFIKEARGVMRLQIHCCLETNQSKTPQSPGDVRESSVAMREAVGVV